ncbi:MAG: dephospho-CoA kinase [Nannocystaceae bacterium]|nr:dephospho-CoA kinase [bacterium]
MDVYGLTGGIGSGKSSVAELLEEYGVPVVSADELSRVVVAAGSEGLGEVMRAFGSDVVDERGELDRRRMATIVFRDPARRQQLEAILHPRIRERFEQVLDALEKAGHPVAIYEVPLLFEKNLQSDMKATILVTASEQTRIARVMERDQVTEGEVRDRIAAQMPEALKRKRADYIIENDGSPDELRREVRFMLERFLRFDARGHGPATKRRTTEVPTTPSAMSTQVPTDASGSPSRTPTEVPEPTPTARPSVGTQRPSSVGTLPHIDPSIDPPPPPGAARTPTRAAPPPPPGLRVPAPAQPSEADAPAAAVPQPPAPPPSSHRTEPALPVVPTTTQKAPVVRDDDEG